MADEAGEALAKTDVFRGMGSGILDHLADKAIRRSYKRGQILFHQGDPGDSLFVLVDGLVKIVVTSPDGDEMVFVTLRPPATFGELSMVDGGPRSASAEAVEPTSVLILMRDDIDALFNDHPEFAIAFLRSTVAVLRRLTEQASDLVFLDLHGRVAKLLLGLANDRGHPTPEGTMLDLHLTQSDLAGMVGGSRQSVNQILRSFESRGYLELHDKRIVLKSTEALGRRAGL